MKPIHLLLPVLLTSIAPVVHAAPEEPAMAPAAVKPPVLPANSPLVATQFERMAKAYNALGSFSIAVVENSEAGNDSDHVKYTAYFCADGRLGLKLAQVDGHGQTSGNNLTQLFDGHEIIGSLNGQRPQRTDAKTGQSDSAPVTSFFANTFGAESIGALWEYGQSPAEHPLYGTYTIQALPGGKIRIENITDFGEGKEAGSAMTVFTESPSGLVESVEATGTEQGRKVFHAVATLSPPAALDTDSLTWEKFGPKPNPNFTIDAPSKEVFERATKLYGQANSFATKISGTLLDSTGSQKTPLWTADVAWERRGRLRFHSSRSSMAYAYDGTTSYVNVKGVFHTVRTFADTPEELTYQMLHLITLDNDPFERFNRLLVNLLQGKSSDFTTASPGIDARKVTLGVDATLYNLPCSVVDVVATVHSKTVPFKLEDRYWFAQSDGRLVRFTSTLKRKNSQVVTDVRLSSQQINAQLPESTWKLMAPVKNGPAH